MPLITITGLIPGSDHHESLRQALIGCRVMADGEAVMRLRQKYPGIPHIPGTFQVALSDMPDGLCRSDQTKARFYRQDVTGPYLFHIPHDCAKPVVRTLRIERTPLISGYRTPMLAALRGVEFPLDLEAIAELYGNHPPPRWPLTAYVAVPFIHLVNELRRLERWLALGYWQRHPSWPYLSIPVGCCEFIDTDWPPAI